MEFTQYKCPVCKKQFEAGDDVVVCPECGTPHHRECYEQSGHCIFESRHAEDFSYEKFNVENREQATDKIVCPVCQTENDAGAFFCNRCGSPLNVNNQNNQSQGSAQNQNNPFNQQNQNQRGVPPYGFGAAGIPNFDPLAGMNGEDEIAEGIKVGEMAKYVGKNTNYFLLIFDRIKKFGRSRFNFCAFLFSGIYFLYRKMYVPGIIISLLIIAINVVSTYVRLTPEYNAAYNEVLSFIGTGGNANAFQALTAYTKMSLIYVPEFLSILRYALMFFSGFLANRLYLKHCTKSIKKIKEENNENINEKLAQKGGVNLAIALSFGIAAIAITFICEYIQLTTL